jgi:hypothetical protein
MIYVFSRGGGTSCSYDTEEVTQSEYFILLFILTANGFSPSGSGTTIKHNTQTTQINKNNTTIKRKPSTQNYNYTYNTHPTQNENTTQQKDRRAKLIMEGRSETTWTKNS